MLMSLVHIHDVGSQHLVPILLFEKTNFSCLLSSWTTIHIGSEDVRQPDLTSSDQQLPAFPSPAGPTSCSLMHVKHDAELRWKKTRIRQSSMDWFAWLANTNLEPSLVYTYGVTLSDNELEEEDIPYLDHELLQSMGISVAKHRLEIVKVAKEECSSRGRPAWSLRRLLAELRKSKYRLLKRFRAVSTDCSGGSSALVTVPRKEFSMGSCRWRDAMVRTNARVMSLKQGRRLPITATSMPADFDHLQVEGKVDSDDHCRRYHRYTSKVEVERTRWASLFRDLNPT